MWKRADEAIANDRFSANDIALIIKLNTVISIRLFAK